MMGYELFGGFGWIWMSLGVLFWAAIVVLAVRLLVTGDGREPVGAATPEEILRRRYALGEISDQQFEARMRVLRGR